MGHPVFPLPSNPSRKAPVVLVHLVHMIVETHGPENLLDKQLHGLVECSVELILEMLIVSDSNLN